jgi:membrane protease YdiL (CAAX protease family)
VAEHHVFWELDWRLKLVVGAVIVAASLAVLRRPQKHPLRFAIALFGLEVGTLVAVRGIVAADGQRWWQFAVAYALVLIPGLFSVVVLNRLGWWRSAGFTPVRAWRSPQSTVVLALTLALPLIGLSGHGVLTMTAGLLAFQVAFLLLDVFMEETIYRGIVIRALQPHGVVRATMWSAVLFGLSHLDNLFLAGSEVGVLYQAFEATLLGVVFGAVRLRTNAIWPVMVAHALYDFILVLAYGHAVPVQPSIPGFIVVTAVNAALAAGALALLRRSRPAVPALECAA